jgi:hypothetical protein
MPGFKPPKTREGIIKMIVEMEGQRAKWHEEQKAKTKAEPKVEKGKKEKVPKTPKGEPGEASKTLKKVSALKGAKQNAQDAV